LSVSLRVPQRVGLGGKASVRAQTAKHLQTGNLAHSTKVVVHPQTVSAFKPAIWHIPKKVMELCKYKNQDLKITLKLS